MNRRLYRAHATWSLAALAFAMTLALAAAAPSAPGGLGPSPISPVAAFPWVPTPEPVSLWDRTFSEAYWMSPLPWVASGLVLFSALAAGLIYLLRSRRSTRVERSERPGPPGRAP
jgi:hypothetical protein